jgi:hypothetical protein
MNIDYNILTAIRNELGEFQITKPLYGKETIALRFGYWRRVSTHTLQHLLEPAGVEVYEYDIDDDDCGTLYSYHLI